MDEQRNSSSRVQRHFTGRPDFIARSAVIVSVAVSTLPPKPPPTVPPTSLSLFERYLEVGGDDAHREVERLRAGVDRQPAIGLGNDQADLRLDRAVLDRGRPIHALDDHVGLLERLVDVALADLPPVHLAFEVWVPVAPMVDDRRVRIGAQAHVEERGLLRELDLDRLDRSHRRLLVFGGDDGDRLALVADVVLREQRLVGGDAEPRQVPVLEQRHVRACDHRVDAGHRLGL